MVQCECAAHREPELSPESAAPLSCEFQFTVSPAALLFWFTALKSRLKKL